METRQISRLKRHIQRQQSKLAKRSAGFDAGRYNKAMIMIIGSEGEFHAKFIFDKLQARGTACFYLDTREFPGTLKIRLTPSNPQSPGSLCLSDGQVIPFEAIRSVYWRYHHGIALSPDIPADLTGIVFRETDSALGSFFRNMPHAYWVNSVSAIERHRFKTHQLMLMAEAGIRVPATLVTNDPEAVLAFYPDQQEQVIYKPVAGGAHTSRVTPDDLTDARLEELRLSPVQFQEYVPGVDIRVYVVGQQLFAAEIQADTLDFRDDPQAPIVPVSLPDDVAAHCLTITRLFEYAFTGIDVRRTPEGEYIFIEANPSPMFVHFENVTGYPISDSLITLLEQGGKHHG